MSELAMRKGETSGGQLHFEASAKLQRLLGRDLLPDDYSAVEELVKNAYDSNASLVEIEFHGEGQHGLVTIRDNGTGVDLPRFSKVWMWAGYSEKIAGKKLPGSKRIQIGEKGIGRFAADRLGEKLTVLTKTAAMTEALSAEFDWKRFSDQDTKLSDVQIPYKFVEATPVPAPSGTVLVIERLREKWDKRKLSVLATRLSGLLNPYGTKQDFRIEIYAPDLDLAIPVEPVPPADPDLEWAVEKSADGSFEVQTRRRTKTGWSQWETLEKGKLAKGTKDFGPVKAHFTYYEKRPPKALVGENAAGVSVFRDGVRIEPAGSHDADWLGLTEKRAKRAGHMPLVPNRLFGFVEIGRTTNPELKDATNRRALIKTPELHSFEEFLKGRLEKFESQVEVEVARPQWEASKEKQAQEILEEGQRTLALLSLSLSHELRQPLQSIQGARDLVAEYLVDKGLKAPEIDQALAATDRALLRINRHINFLKKLGASRELEPEDVDVGQVVHEVYEAFAQIAEARNIKIVEPPAFELRVRSNSYSLLMSLINLVQNAYDALRQGTSNEKTIRIEVETTKAQVRIRVIDNGPGVPERDRARLFTRLSTSKQGSMGVALAIWRDAVRIFKGDLVCESFASPTTFAVVLPRGK